MNLGDEHSIPKFPDKFERILVLHGRLNEVLRFNKEQDQATRQALAFSGKICCEIGGGGIDPLSENCVAPVVQLYWPFLFPTAGNIAVESWTQMSNLDQ